MFLCVLATVIKQEYKIVLALKDCLKAIYAIFGLENHMIPSPVAVPPAKLEEFDMW